MEPSGKVDGQLVSRPPVPADDEYVQGTSVPPAFAPQYAAVMDYLLNLDIPDKYKDEFDNYKPMLTRSLALANIKRTDIGRYLDYFDVIALWYKHGQPHMARKRMARMVTELTLTRSVDGFERIAQVTTRSEMKQTMIPGEEKVKRGWWIFSRSVEKKEAG